MYPFRDNFTEPHTIGSFSVIAIFMEKLHKKKAKSVIETPKLCANKNPLVDTIQRPIQNTNINLKMSKIPKKTT